MGRNALIAGGSGLVGGFILGRLLESDCYDHVIAVGRRRLDIEHPKLQQRIVDFDNLADEQLPSVHDVFCALGTTIRAAGSQEAFRRIDHDYVLRLAEETSRSGARQFLLVSSMGADVASRFFYNRVKGETERDVAQVPFQGIQIFRPSLLLGRRSESRPLERISAVMMRLLSFLMIGPWRRYRAIDADSVAASMVVSALRGCSGVRIITNDRMLGAR